MHNFGCFLLFQFPTTEPPSSLSFQKQTKTSEDVIAYLDSASSSNPAGSILTLGVLLTFTQLNLTLNKHQNICLLKKLFVV